MSAAGQPGPKFFDRLLRTNWRDDTTPDFYAPDDGHYLAGEPAFVPRPGEPSRGVILVHELDPDRRESWFVVLDAYDLSRGPVARLAIEGLAHPGFHSCFCAAE